MIKRILLTIAALISLTACSAIDVAEPSERAQIKNIAIYSAMGDELQYNYRGTTILTDRTSAISVADWTVDNYIEQILQSQLEMRKYNVRSLRGEVSFQPELSRFSTYTDPMALIQSAHEKGFDTLAVVEPFYRRLTYNGELEKGYGVAHKVNLVNESTYVYAFSYLRIYDTATQKLIAMSPGYEIDQFMIPEVNAVKKISDPQWQDRYDAYSVEDKAKIRSRIEDLLKRNMVYALGTMNL